MAVFHSRFFLFRRDPRKFYWIDEPKFNGSLQDAVQEEAILLVRKTNGNQAHPVKVPLWTMAWMVGGIGLMKS